LFETVTLQLVIQSSSDIEFHTTGPSTEKKPNGRTCWDRNAWF